MSPAMPSGGRRIAWARAVLVLCLTVLAACDQDQTTGYDLAVIVDNRPSADRPAARADIDALAAVMARHMGVDRVIRLRRPSYDLVCDVFGGCPEDAGTPWPPLIAQIARKGRSRILVHYLGPARIEGLRRELLFAGTGRAAAVRSYDVGWLHYQLGATAPTAALVILESGFAPRPLPCAGADPRLIDQASPTLRRNYARLIEGGYLPSPLAELSAIVPEAAAGCDRYLLPRPLERPPFTRLLVEAIAGGKADRAPHGNQDGLITLGELSAYADERIAQLLRLQGGERRSVWPIGPAGKRVAEVRPRAPAAPSAAAGGGPPTPRARPHDGLPATGPCAACRDARPGDCPSWCQDDGDQGLFSGDVVAELALEEAKSPCADRPPSAVCPCREDDPRAACPGAWCRWSAAMLAPRASDAVQTVLGGTDDLCGWTRAALTPRAARSPFGQLLMPIVWRLGRGTVQASIACVLDCEGLAGLPVEPAVPVPDLPAPPPGRAAGDGEGIAMPPPVPLPPLCCRRFALPPPVALPPRRFALPPPVPLAPRRLLPRLLSFAMPPPAAAVPARFAFRPTVGKVRWLQSALILENHNPGPIDGALGERTMGAVRAWRRSAGRPSWSEAVAEVEFERIVEALAGTLGPPRPGEAGR